MRTSVRDGLWATVLLFASADAAPAQQDPGIRGGFNNTAGMLQFRGIPIPPPPVISPHPTDATWAPCSVPPIAPTGHAWS
jgi:hypothetical protein